MKRGGQGAKRGADRKGNEIYDKKYTQNFPQFA